MQHNMVLFKGIIRGACSEIQSEERYLKPIYQYTGSTIEEVLDGLVLDEWIFTIHINGRPIRNIKQYLKIRGLWTTREQAS